MRKLPGEENVASLFQADTLAPAQYHQSFRRTVCLEPEQELMLAVLEDAVCCFESYAAARDKKRMRGFLEVEEWIMNEDKGNGYFPLTTSVSFWDSLRSLSVPVCCAARKGN